MLLSCSNCFDILKNPVECNYCNTNFCKEHIKNFKFCPHCKKDPFSYHINAGIIKILEKHENEIIKNDNQIIECIICNFRTNPGNLCYHLAEEHKKVLIENFGRKVDSQIEKEQKVKKIPPKKNNNQKDKNIENYYTFNNNNYNLNNNNLNDNFPQNSNNINNKNIQSEKMVNKSLNLKQNIINSNNSKNLEKKNMKKSNTSRKFENFPNNELSKSINNNLYYCNEKNTKINCQCCLPSQICRLGNCLCVKCMKKNVDLFNLEKGELFNKAGRIARPENGEYHCGKKFILSLQNSVGEMKPGKKQCSLACNFCCKECTILNMYKDIYLKYVWDAN